MHILIRLQAFAALLVCIWVIGFFGIRVHTIAQMRGMIPGIQLTKYQVTEKWKTAGSLRRGPSYGISWASNDGQLFGDHSTMMDEDRWRQLRVGDTVTIARGSIERAPYVLHNYIQSDSSLIVNSLLVCGAFAWAIWMCYVILTVKQRRTSPWERV